MKVKCVFNTGNNLSENTLQAGYSKTTRFNLDIDKEYAVYGMSMWKGSLNYLLAEDPSTPSFYPAELFEVTDHLLPLIWFFNFEKYENYEGKESSTAVWGYKEMVLDPDHYIALLEGKLEALSIFNKRKEKIDEWQELRSQKST